MVDFAVRSQGGLRGVRCPGGFCDSKPRLVTLAGLDWMSFRGSKPGWTSGDRCPGGFCDSKPRLVTLAGLDWMSFRGSMPRWGFVDSGVALVRPAGSARFCGSKTSFFLGGGVLSFWAYLFVLILVQRGLGWTPSVAAGSIPILALLWALLRRGKPWGIRRRLP
jgi:hypothetical protein